jgi:hypothetical protein
VWTYPTRGRAQLLANLPAGPTRSFLRSAIEVAKFANDLPGRTAATSFGRFVRDRHDRPRVVISPPSAARRADWSTKAACSPGFVGGAGSAETPAARKSPGFQQAPPRAAAIACAPASDPGLITCRQCIPSPSQRLALCSVHADASAASAGASILTRLRPNNSVSGE